jgi:MOSC domain-containing protein YiiM
VLTLAELTARYAQAGTVTWIGLRPSRHADMLSVTEADVALDGLAGDHARPGKRALTLVQAEHLPVIASLADLPEVLPETFRRNLVVSGLNLTAFRKAVLRIGDVEIRLSGPCAPCSRMETALGQGGYTAMRGHGGMTAEILVPGRIKLGDRVEPI